MLRTAKNPAVIRRSVLYSFTQLSRNYLTWLKLPVFWNMTLCQLL